MNGKLPHFLCRERIQKLYVVLILIMIETGTSCVGFCRTAAEIDIESHNPDVGHVIHAAGVVDLDMYFDLPAVGFEPEHCPGSTPCQKIHAVGDFGIKRNAAEPFSRLPPVKTVQLHAGRIHGIPIHTVEGFIFESHRLVKLCDFPFRHVDLSDYLQASRIALAVFFIAPSEPPRRASVIAFIS